MRSGVIVLSLSMAVVLGIACRRSPSQGPAVGTAAAATTAAAGAPAPAPEPAPPRGTQLTLLYSSSMNGEYEPCG